MASKGDMYEGATLDWLLGDDGPAPNRPTARKLKLFTALPNEAGAGGVEVDTAIWANYARKDITFGPKVGTSPTQRSNSVLVDFGVAVCSANVTVLGASVVDQNGYQIYGPHEFAVPQIVQNGNPVTFPVGSIVCTED